MTNHDFKISAQSMRRVIATPPMLGQPARQVFGGPDIAA
jgi:hypothetical protein